MNKRVLFLATLLVGSFSGACFAQSEAQPKWMDSTTAKVKPEMRQEFEGYLKQLMEAYRKTGTPWFLTLENLAGDTTEYTTIVPVMKFADLDDPSALTQALGKTGWEQLSRNMAQCYTAQTRQYVMPRAELEINQKDVPMGIYWVETSTLVAQGKLQDYLKWLQNDYLPALKKAGVAHFEVSQPVFGALAGEIVTRRMLKNFAEIDEGPVLSKALSEEDARAVNARYVPLVSSATTKLVRVRADLSYSPGK